LGPLLLLPLSALVGYLAGQAATRRELRQFKPVEPPPAPKPTPPPAPVAISKPAAPEDVTPEVLMVLSAAVAAFLGKKAKIRSARLMRPTVSSAWAQQGRVFVQASHALPYRAR
jgi:methylmalonyl-CoA carboxyltransferase large subunit